MGRPLQLHIELDGRSLAIEDFMAEQMSAGILILQDGRIRLEAYSLGYSPEGRWTSFSVAKSITSTLVGAAIHDGYIGSIDDRVTQYIPALRGSAYEGVSVHQLLTMTSGVKWNEDYADPQSDVAKLYSVRPDAGMDATVSYLRKLPREAPPGVKWVYKTGETNLIGVLVSAATHQSLADYLSRKIWQPYGMEQDAEWLTDERGQEFGGCCLSASLHDFGRFGLLMLEGGAVNGKRIVPDGWIEAATRKQADTGVTGQGYGYQWWTQDDGSFDALGIYGQTVHIDPSRKLVVVICSAWPVATDPAHRHARAELIAAVNRAIDSDAGD